MTASSTLRRSAKLMLQMPGALSARLWDRAGRSPRFAGAYPSRAAALASLPPEKQAGYDDKKIADVSFAQMCVRQSWDYPLLYWMQHLLAKTPTVIDAGGHLGTKYIAFSEVIDLRATNWVVYDLPGIIEAARQRQSAGALPAEISFIDDMSELPESDLLIASGLLQYLDVPFSDFVGRLAHKPKYILLNKVAVRDGPAIFTIERIGAGRVPYHVRARLSWQEEIAELGYRIHDSWTIPSLGHVIATHPWRGRSESCGYLLVKDGESV